jgi:hypothetical protein
MPPSRSQQSLPLTVLALLFVAGAIFYTSISVYYYSRPLTSLAFVGIEYDLHVETRAIVIKRVVPGGPAEEAGLRAKDVVTAVNGRPLDTLNPLYDAVFRGLSGDTVRFTVRRGGEAAPIELRATLRSRPPQDEHGLPQRIAETVMRFYPVPATLVGLAVLLLRRGERHAWLLALLFSGLATGALTELGPDPPGAARVHAQYALLFGGLCRRSSHVSGDLPGSSPLDRRVPG